VLRVDKLALAIVQDQDAQPLIDAVVARGYRVTRMDTVGGFLRKGNATLLIGIDDRHLPGLFYLIRQHCRTRTTFLTTTTPLDMGEPLMLDPIEVQVGGAVVFIVDVERFEPF